MESKDPSNAAAERFRAAGKHGRNGRYLTGATETAGWTARKKLHGRKKKHEQAQSFEGRDRSGRIRGDAVFGYELKDKNGTVVAASDSSTPLSGVRVKTAQTTLIALDGVTEGSEYTLTVTGRQSGKAVTVDF